MVHGVAGCSCQTPLVQVDEFWSLVEKARADVSGDGVLWPPGSVIGKALTVRLAQLPTERIVEFYYRYHRVVARAHQWELCAAAYVIWGYISDVSSPRFLGGLVIWRRLALG